MRLVIFDIQRPLDPQVNGLGLYRTVVDGTSYLQIDQVHIPLETSYACTYPWEAADVTSEGLVLIGACASQFTFNPDTTPSACMSTQIWEIQGEGYRNSEDGTNGYRGLNLWEHTYLLEKDSAFVETRWTWAYCTTTADASLGTTVEDDNDVPPFASLVAAYSEHIFLSGDPDNPNYLYWSKRFHPEAWPQENFIEIGNADDPIKQILPIAGVLGVFTRATKYRVTGNATSGFVHWEALSHRGTQSPKSVLATDKGILFVSPDGVWVTNLISPDEKISDKIEGLFLGTDADTNMSEDPINKNALNQIAAGYYKNKYYFSYPSGTNTKNNKTALFDFDTKEWTIYDHAMSSMITEDDAGLFVAGGSDGNLYILETGTSDDSSKISYDSKTKEYYEGAGYGVRCLFLYFKVDAKLPTGEALTADFIVDGVVVGTAQITGDKTKVLNPLPEGCWGYRWQVRFSGSSAKQELEVAGVSALYLPLGVS